MSTGREAILIELLICDLDYFYFSFRMGQDLHKIVSNITIDDVRKFSRTLFESPVYIEMLVQGNMTKEEATSIFETTAKTFNATEIKSYFNRPEIVIKKVPNEGTKVVRIDGFNPKNNNTIVSNYYQNGLGSLRTEMFLAIACQIMSEPVFDTLRTKEQLAYNVFGMSDTYHGIQGVTIQVESQVSV